MPDERQAILELLGKMPEVTASQVSLDPAELENQRQTEAQMLLARKFLGRDLRAEAQAEAEAARPKSKLGKILEGFGQGVLYAQNPKYQDKRERTFGELTQEYNRVAPVLQRDISAYEGNQARLQSKREELASKQNAEALKFRTNAAKLLLDNAELVQRDPEVAAKVRQLDAQAGKLGAEAALTQLQKTFAERNGVLMGKASSKATDAQLGLGNQQIQNAMRGNEAFTQGLGAMRDVLKGAARGGGASGAKTRSSESWRYQNINGQMVLMPSGSTSTTSGGGGGQSPAQTQQLMDLVGKTFGTGSVQPFGETAQQPSGLQRVLGLPAQAGTSASVSPTPMSTAGPTAQVERPVPRIVGDAPTKPMTVTEKANADAHEAMKQHADTALYILSDKDLKTGLDDRMGDTLGGPTVSWLRRTKRGWLGTRGMDAKYDQAMDTLVQSAVENLWEKVADKSGKTVNPGELRFGESSTVRLNKDKTGILDNPDAVVNKLIGQRIFVAVQELKNQVFNKTKGDEEDKKAAVRGIGDLTEAMRNYQLYLFNQWQQNKRISSEDFDVKKILPHMLGSPAERELHKYQNRKK